MGQANQIGSGGSTGRKDNVHISQKSKTKCFEEPLERAPVQEVTERHDILVAEIRHSHWGEMINIYNFRPV